MNDWLTGVKVPDENLTPQQRQHREEQLATLRKMQQMLFPEHHSPPSLGPSELDAELLVNHKGQPSDWQKLQLQFYDERKKKGNVVAGGRGQGPPPPYHQATRSASVPAAVASPTPGSPSLSLPSPRTLSSPAEPKMRPDSPTPQRSNPPTPVSTHLSPKKENKSGNNSGVGEFSPTSNMSASTSQQSPGTLLSLYTSFIYTDWLTAITQEFPHIYIVFTFIDVLVNFKCYNYLEKSLMKIHQ